MQISCNNRIGAFDCFFLYFFYFLPFSFAKNCDSKSETMHDNWLSQNQCWWDFVLIEWNMILWPWNQTHIHSNFLRIDSKRHVYLLFLYNEQVFWLILLLLLPQPHFFTQLIEDRETKYALTLYFPFLYSECSRIKQES